MSANEGEVTFPDMCERIVESGILTRQSDGKGPTAEEIFNYSPTGELFMIFTWYKMAQAVLKRSEL